MTKRSSANTGILPALVILSAASVVVARGKVGLCCKECSAKSYSPFAGSASWAYRYQLFVDDTEAAIWLHSNNIEFVPHLAHKQVPLPGGSSCTLETSEISANIPLCTATILDAAISASNNKAVTTKYLMGWNEAYDNSNSKSKKKYIRPVDAATYWRTFVQGLAARNGNLSLVSPTTGVSKGKMEWMGDMLLACWAQRSEGCDVETIKAFSVHDYKCGESYWRSNYGINGTFQRSLKAYLAMAGVGKDWSSYVDTRPIWVTETNCNGDYGFPHTHEIYRSEQCARITGQRADDECGNEAAYGKVDTKCGIGSLAALEQMENIARVSWWNTWQTNKKNVTATFNAMLVSATGHLYPAGRAIVNGLDNTTDCSKGLLQ